MATVNHGFKTVVVDIWALGVIDVISDFFVRSFHIVVRESVSQPPAVSASCLQGCVCAIHPIERLRKLNLYSSVVQLAFSKCAT